MNLFDILGPVMVGPSSSHTAGAVRIGYISLLLLDESPLHVDIILHGSFATTGVGHGTHKALIAGLLGMQPDDEQIPCSFSLAEKQGFTFSFSNKTIKDAHPNTAVLVLTGKSGRTIEVQAYSIGGGRIMIHKLDGITVDFTADKPTLIIYHQDKPGYVAKVSSVLADQSVNIATMQLHRQKRGGYAIMVMETDHAIPKTSVEWLKNVEGVHFVTYMERGKI
ncbi:L-serine ammonia-lyase, iron-sulfur-dependent subunit beta [Lachnospiraceae bacterium OttesenSCG-928-D06]|nr:L-serine ammonia-lyase, iron-sulfur-dependent subunit beta [Lachnospiraceae bacterium OttesenSCG-928-D06]